MHPACALSLGAINWVVPARVVQQFWLVDRSSSRYEAANDVYSLNTSLYDELVRLARVGGLWGGLLIVNEECSTAMMYNSGCLSS